MKRISTLIVAFTSCSLTFMVTAFSNEVLTIVRTLTPPGSKGNNVFVGHSGNTSMSPAGGPSDWASYNTVLGERAFEQNTTGFQNVALGYATLYANTSGQGNVAVGMRALYRNRTGYHNVAIGTTALANQTSAVHNVGIGADTLYFNTVGSYNMAMGYDALHMNDTGAGNVSLGYSSMYANVDGTGNIAIGLNAGFTGTPNVSGNENIWIGMDAGPGTDTPLNNSIAIGARAQNTASDQVILGNEDVDTTILRGDVSAAMSLTVGSSQAPAAPAGVHHYLTIRNRAMNSSGPIVDAAAISFDADPGAHNAVDTGTTKPDIGEVAAWMKVNLNGSVGYIPIYAAK